MIKRGAVGENECAIIVRPIVILAIVPTTAAITTPIAIANKNNNSTNTNDKSGCRQRDGYSRNNQNLADRHQRTGPAHDNSNPQQKPWFPYDR